MTKIERQRQKNREVHEAIARVAAKACKPVDQAPEQPANLIGKRISFMFGHEGELFGRILGDGYVGGARYLDVATIYRPRFATRNPGTPMRLVYLVPTTSITGISE